MFFKCPSCIIVNHSPSLREASMITMCIGMEKFENTVTRVNGGLPENLDPKQHMLYGSNQLVLPTGNKGKALVTSKGWGPRILHECVICIWMEKCEDTTTRVNGGLPESLNPKQHTLYGSNQLVLATGNRGKALVASKGWGPRSLHGSVSFSCLQQVSVSVGNTSCARVDAVLFSHSLRLFSVHFNFYVYLNLIHNSIP